MPSAERLPAEEALCWLTASVALRDRGRFRGALRAIGRARKLDGGAIFIKTHGDILRAQAFRLGRGKRRLEEQSALERALLVDADLCASYPGSSFSALTRLGRYREAFALGESRLDSRADLDEILGAWRQCGLNYVPNRLKKTHRRTLAALGKKRLFLPWVHFYQAFAETGAPRLALLRLLRGDSPRRYGWMRLALARELLAEKSFQEAAGDLRSSLRFKPKTWQTHGLLAEAYVCLGEREKASRQLALATGAAPRAELPEALAWAGEIDLWMGLYRRARERLARACAGGSLFALCWRAAAELKLGDLKGAMNALDDASARCPWDNEIPVWRAEALLRLDRPRKALASLRGARQSFWPRVLGALAWARLGDAQRAWRELNAIPRPLRASLLARVRLADGAGAGAVAASLERALRLSRGFRRDDYSQRAWLGAVRAPD